MEIFGIPLQGFLSQLLLGLVNGSFYAMLSLGLAVIFGLLGIVNFAHGALYMIGAYVAWLGLDKLGINYWMSLIVAPLVVGAFGVDVPLMVMLTYAAGAGLAAIAGVLAAPVIQVTPLMGSNLIIVVFAVVVIGGMGSILGSILTGLLLGIVEGLTKVFYPEASNIVVFVIMAIVLIIRPAGLFGKEE